MKFYVADCNTKTEVSIINENDTVAWNDGFTVGFDPEAGGKKVTRVDFVLNNSLKHVEHRPPWHINGDWVPIKLDNGPCSATATVWIDGKREYVKTVHFKAGPPQRKVDCDFGLCTQSSAPGYLYDYKGVSHVGAFRLWHDIVWGNLPQAKSLAQYDSLVSLITQKTGLQAMILCLTTNVVPTKDQSVAWHSRMADLLAARYSAQRNLIHVEIGNEPNLKSYWSGSADDYINLQLAVAYPIYKERGIAVIGAAPSENVTYLQSLKSRGYLELCDIAAFHPYGRSVQTHIDRTKQARDVVGNKQLWLTEWNAHLQLGGMTLQEWADAVPKMAAGINGYADAAFYYRLIRKQKLAGWGGLFEPGTYKPTEFLPEFSIIR